MGPDPGPGGGVTMLQKYRVQFIDFNGKKHRVLVRAANRYLAANLARLKYETLVDLIISVKEVS